MAASPAPPLRGKHFYLRAVLPDDLPYLFLVETSSELASRGGLRGSTPAYAEWTQNRGKAVLAQFMVLSARDNARVGLVTAFSADFQDGHAHIAAARFDPGNRSPLMMLATGRFIDYVFRCWDLHKLYLDVAEYNVHQFASGEGRWFALEGRLRRHHYLDGRHWDHLIFAIHRDEWEQRAPLLRRVEAMQ